MGNQQPLSFAEPHFQRLNDCTSYNRRASDFSAAFCVFCAHKMAAAGAFPLEPATGGNLDSLSQTLMGFLLRHQDNPFKKDRAQNVN